MTKWIKVDKDPWGTYVVVALFNKIAFYAGQTDHWGIGANINLYDRSITFEIFNLYAGAEVWHSARKADS